MGIDAHISEAQKVRTFLPGYMTMGQDGMADMGEMGMITRVIASRWWERLALMITSLWAASIPISRCARIWEI